jgi:SH3 domain protein
MNRRIFLLILVCCIQQSWAESVYIQDLIYVPLRDGTSNQHRVIHRGIPSGTLLELIREDPESGFSFVRLQDGTEGWLRSQYLSPEPIARDLLNVASQRLDELEEENEELRQTIDAMQINETSLVDENSSLSQKAQAIQTELDELTRLAENVIGIHKENVHLKDRNKLLLEELNMLSHDNSELMRTREREWFLAGALTLLVGMLPGFWFARKIYNRSTSGWT